MKPLKGVDDDLFENLCSFAEQDYPEFEIILGVEDIGDPALGVAERVRQRYPGVAIQVIVEPRRIGLNPKVNTLANLARIARHGYFLISDSNVRVEPDYLRCIAAEFADPRVGLVSNLIAGTGERVLGALLENLHLNSFVASGVAGVERITGHVCVVGKSMLFRRQDLERLGGFARVANYLAEDYWLGRMFSDAGWKVVTSCHVIRTVNRSWPVRRFVSRHLRWAQMRRRIWLTAYLAELFTNPCPWLLLLAAIAVSDMVNGSERRDLLAISGLGLLLKVLLDGLLNFRLRGQRMVWGLLLIPMKDLLIFAIWCVGLFKRTTDWRGNAVRLGPGSLLSCPEPRFRSPEASIFQQVEQGLASRFAYRK